MCGSTSNTGDPLRLRQNQRTDVLGNAGLSEDSRAAASQQRPPAGHQALSYGECAGLIEQNPLIYGEEMNVWKFKSCSKCGGDLFAQDGEWSCIQCGRYYYPANAEPIEIPPPPTEEPVRAVGACRKRMRCGGIAGRNINAVVNAQRARAERWRAKNRQIIACLKEGKSVSEAATLLGKNPRQVRNVAALLREMSVLASA